MYTHDQQSSPKKNKAASSAAPHQLSKKNNAANLADNRPVQRKANNTGLPDQLKSGIENLSGYSLDDVKVHFNSPKPAQLNAHAYAQGTEIHLASGQEKHLPHEAWHVVQQKQGRVQATRQMKSSVSINDDKGLEKEADIMGQAALRMRSAQDGGKSLSQQNVNGGIVQRVITMLLHEEDDIQFTDADRQKMDAVKAYVDTSLAGIFSDLERLFVNVVHMPGTNPADTSRISEASIRVRLADWFVHVSSVGDICGMLAHEIGVHTLADDQMADHHKQEETAAQANPFRVRVGLHTHEVGPWRGPGRGRQRDHVNVVRDQGVGHVPLRNATDPDSTNHRAIQYAAMMLRLGDAIDADATLSPQQKDQHLHDLLNSFLFDYARIIVTDDRGIRTWDKAPLVAQVFNWYRNVIITRYGAAHAWLLGPSMQPTASTWGLRAYLMSKVSYALALQAKAAYPAALTPAPGGTVGRLAGAAGTGLGMLGGAASSIGSFVSAWTPGIVKSGLRAADHVYGEAENLVVPKVVGAGLATVNAGMWLWQKGRSWMRR